MGLGGGDLGQLELKPDSGGAVRLRAQSVQRRK